jgi:hypothetical protein
MALCANGSPPARDSLAAKALICSRPSPYPQGLNQCLLMPDHDARPRMIWGNVLHQA